MSEIPVSKVNFTITNSIEEWEKERLIYLIEKNTLPKLKSEVINLSEAIDSYKEGDNKSYTKLKDVLDRICELRKK